jgi:hypothetical protein
MLLEKVAHYNDLSPKLRKELEDRIKGFGNTVRYKFDIARPNPDPHKENGIEVIYPQTFTLDPCKFTINDTLETREGVSKAKQIALVDALDEKGLPSRYRKVKVEAKHKGIYTIDLTNPEGVYFAMFLELHPKLVGGQFADKNKRQLVTRIDENKYAKDERTHRTLKLKALNSAQSMSDKDLVNFADAMSWDSNLDIDILRNKVEDLAEKTPSIFIDLIESKKVEYQAAVKQAKDKNIIAFEPSDYKFIWVGNQQTITMLSPNSTKNEIEQFAEWLQVGGEKADEVYKRIKGLLK